VKLFSSINACEAALSVSVGISVIIKSIMIVIITVGGTFCLSRMFGFRAIQSIATVVAGLKSAGQLLQRK
jgi:hypothetical protein